MGRIRRTVDPARGAAVEAFDDAVDLLERTVGRWATDAGERSEGDRTVRHTGRWRGVVAVVLVAVAIGILAKRPSVLLVAAVGVAFAAYPQVTATPEPDLSIERRFVPESPADGETVDVRTTIRNEGEATLFDLRVVDGVPPMLAVEDGSPRSAVALEPGEETALEYSVRATPGRHRFQPTSLLCRDVSGSIEVETRETVETTLECAARIPSVPLRAHSRHRSGHLVTDEGGSGLEFHQVKEYERGDPVGRIDWRRFARTGELTSLEFRAERLADVVVCVDARAAAFRAGSPDEPHAVAHAVDAAGRIGDALFDADQRVGLAAFGRDRCLLPPGAGRRHEERFHRRLATDPALSLTPPESTRATEGLPGTVRDREADGGASLDRQLATIRTAVDADTQVLLLTPLCDDAASRVAQHFESGGGAVTVVSPDVTTGDSVGGRLARLEREHRLAALRNADIPAVDWSPDEPLGTALEGVERWDR